jgi:hypothetical protein
VTSVYTLLIVEALIFGGLLFLWVPWFKRDNRIFNFLSYFSVKVMLIFIIGCGVYLQWITIEHVAIRGFSFLAFLFSLSVAGLYVGIRGKKSA